MTRLRGGLGTHLQIRRVFPAWLRRYAFGPVPQIRIINFFGDITSREHRIFKRAQIGVQFTHRVYQVIKFLVDQAVSTDKLINFLRTSAVSD